MITKERRLSRFILILMAASGLMAGTAHADELRGMELAEQIAETAEAAVDSAGAVADIMNGGDEDGTGLSQAIYDEYREESLRDQIVSYAMQFVGGRYRYGGTSLTSGVDCSGYVMKIFQNFGIDTGRDSRTQAQRSRTIDASQLRPGDLVFYGSGGRVNHVGIYIGDGLIVHASNERTGIKVSSMYYRAPMKLGTFL